MDFTLTGDLSGVDWARLVADLERDEFHNGRTVDELRRSFEASDSVLAVADAVVIGTARLLTDGVCNAWLVDVWTASTHRRAGVGSAMVRQLLSRVPGQHVALFTEHHEQFYRTLGFQVEEVGMSQVVGTWLGRRQRR